MARKTQGTQLFTFYPQASSVAVVDVGCVQSIDGIDSVIDQIETTCLADSDRTYLPGLAQPGQASFEINFDPADETHELLFNWKQAQYVLKWALGFSGSTAAPGLDLSNLVFAPPTGRSWLLFEGFMTNFPSNFQQNSVVKSTINLQISGAITLQQEV